MCLRSAAIGDVVEVSYQVRLPGQAPAQGQIVDGAESLAAEGVKLFWMMKECFVRLSLMTCIASYHIV